MSNPVVSIVIPTNNRSEKLRRLLTSVLASDIPSADMEIVIVADNCHDDTINMLRTDFPVVSVFETPVAAPGTILGSAFSRTLGASNSTAPFICFIDDDNIVHPEMVGILVNVLRSDPAVGEVGPVMWRWPEGSGVWCVGANRDRFGLVHHVGLEGLKSEDDSPELLRDCDYIPNVFCVRRSVLQEIPFDVEHFPHSGAEIDWGIRLKVGGYRVLIALLAKDWHDVGYRGWTNRIESAALVYDQARARIVLRYIHRSKSIPFPIFLILWLPIVSVYISLRLLRSGNFATSMRSFARGNIDALRVVNSWRKSGGGYPN